MTAAEPRRETLVARYALPPAEIARRSLSFVEQALAAQFRDPDERRVATRICYAAGDLALSASLRFSPGAVADGVAALRGGCDVIVDVKMVAAGLDQPQMERLRCTVHSRIDAPEAKAIAQVSGYPRALEAMRLLRDRLTGAVVAIGNAPTALLALLDMIDAGTARPALVIGMPVGFVAAAESKQELTRRAVPYITVLGTRGGSPLAAAALNALLYLGPPDWPVPATPAASATPDREASR